MLSEAAAARDEVQAALRDLPTNQCVVLTLRDLEGWAADEVCTLLGITPANQRVLLHRARLALRNALAATLNVEQRGGNAEL